MNITDANYKNVRRAVANYATLEFKDQDARPDTDCNNFYNQNCPTLTYRENSRNFNDKREMP